MKKMFMVSALFASMLHSTPVIAKNEQFDLICTGNQRSNFGQPTEKTTPFNIRFSVDLTNMVYAMANAESPSQIYNATPKVIVFSNKITKSSSDEMSVSRINGDFFWLTSLSLSTISKKSEMIGTCTKAEFTKMPTTLF